VLHERFSVFWGTPSKNGRILAGSDATRYGLPRPSSGELLVSGAEFALNYLAGMPRAAALHRRKLRSMRVAGGGATKELLSPHRTPPRTRRGIARRSSGEGRRGVRRIEPAARADARDGRLSGGDGNRTRATFPSLCV
jgi:hypothetical protein